MHCAGRKLGNEAPTTIIHGIGLTVAFKKGSMSSKNISRVRYHKAPSSWSGSFVTHRTDELRTSASEDTVGMM